MMKMSLKTWIVCLQFCFTVVSTLQAADKFVSFIREEGTLELVTSQQRSFSILCADEEHKGVLTAVHNLQEDFYNENRDVIDRLMADQEKIAAFMRDNQEETLKIVAQELDLDEQAVKDMYACYDFSLDVSDEDRAGFQKTADFMLESGMIEEPFDVNTLFFQ